MTTAGKHLQWRKSSYSGGNGGNGGNCVESVAFEGRTLVRDSKLDDNSPIQAFAPQAWRSLTDGLRTVGR